MTSQLRAAHGAITIMAIAADAIRYLRPRISHTTASDAGPSAGDTSQPNPITDARPAPADAHQRA